MGFLSAAIAGLAEAAGVEAATAATIGNATAVAAAAGSTAIAAKSAFSGGPDFPTPSTNTTNPAQKLTKPDESGRQAQEARDRSLRRSLLRRQTQGRRSSILTSALGVGNDFSLNPKSLIGLG